MFHGVPFRTPLVRERTERKVRDDAHRIQVTHYFGDGKEGDQDVGKTIIQSHVGYIFLSF